MARYETEFFSVDDDRHQLVTAIAELATAGDGWVNLEPKVGEDSRVEVSGFFAWFSARGPRVPVGTFVAGNDGAPASVGLAHGSGRGAGDRLEDLGVQAPSDWSPRQDHAKHGLVWQVHPQKVDAAAVAEILLKGTTALASVPTIGGWVVTVHRPV